MDSEDPSREPPGAGRIVVAIVGDGQRAAAFRELALRSPRTLLADVGRSDAGWDIAGALARYPAARFVIALPPRAALDAALEVARAGRSALVEAPLALSAPDDALTGSGVQVAHGWVTLRRGWFEQVIERGVAAVELTFHGLPEEPGGDLQEVLVHALALLKRLFPHAEPRSASVDGDAALTAHFSHPGGTRIVLEARAAGQRLEARASGADFSAVWRWQPDEEVRELHADRREVRRLPAASGTERALAQLVDPDRHGGDTLRDAAGVLDLARRTLALLPHRLVTGTRTFRQAIRRAERHPDDPLAPLGLRGRLEPGPEPSLLELPRLPEPQELWSFRAGDKPVVFLTLQAGEVDKALGWFEGTHVERRERRVAAGPHDAWQDRRDLGEPRVELYIARDAKLARRAAQLQAAGDPSRTARELGELMGYPACCVEAFVKLADRSNNSRNRYATAAHAGPGSWPWQLNNFFVMLLPFFPCRYDCPAALARAERVLAEIGKVHSQATAALARSLSRPLLYFAHGQMLVFDGKVEDGALHYHRAYVPEGTSPAFRRLAQVAGTADALGLDDRALRFFEGGRLRAAFERTDPALGLIADFGPSR